MQYNHTYYYYVLLHLAGGVATIIDADFVATLLPQGIKYKAMTDGGLAKLPRKCFVKLYSPMFCV